MEREVLFEILKSKIESKRQANNNAERDISTIGSWSCDYNEWIAHIDKEISAIVTKLGEMFNFDLEEFK